MARPVRALVPTMGALHEGHQALIRRARQMADEVVVSVFVNPLQFGPNEDFSRYPRSLERDVELAADAGADAVYAPEAEELTPGGLVMSVDPGAMGTVLCGAYRPGHFQGVCTIVLKLFNLVQPGLAVFGWKDAQQFLILRKMVQDLDIPVKMEGMDTVRDADGLAMSSRNRYLNAEERVSAPAIYQALQEARQALEAGVSTVEVEQLLETRLARVPGLLLQYGRVLRLADLGAPTGAPGEPLLVAVAAYLGNTRLIDNVRVGAEAGE